MAEFKPIKIAERLTARLDKANAELKALRKRERTARILLTGTLDAIPNYIDGRYDRLLDGIANWLDYTKD